MAAAHAWRRRGEAMVELSENGGDQGENGVGLLQRAHTKGKGALWLATAHRQREDLLVWIKEDEARRSG